MNVAHFIWKWFYFYNVGAFMLTGPAHDDLRRHTERVQRPASAPRGARAAPSADTLTVANKVSNDLKAQRRANVPTYAHDRGSRSVARAADPAVPLPPRTYDLSKRCVT